MNEIENEVTDLDVENYRRARVTEINSDPGNRMRLEAKYGKVYTLDELAVEFEIIGFGAPFVVVRRKSDGSKGSFEFQHSPRFYFSFKAD